MRWRSFVSVALAAIVIGSIIATDPGVRTTYASSGHRIKMEKVYAKAFHGFLKPYFFGSHGASDAQLRR